MITIDKILADLEKISSTYVKLLLDIPNFSATENLISWDKYQPSIFKSLYFREYEQLLKQRQFSFLLADKSFIQFYYLFDSDKLIKAKLAYYPYPLLLTEEVNDIEFYMDESSDKDLDEYYYDLWNLLSSEFNVPISDKSLLKELNLIQDKDIDLSEYALMKFENKYKITNSSHMRIDFDSNVETHHKCEIQIGAVNYIRFPMEKLISPFSFFDFIIRNLSLKDKLFTSYEEIQAKSNFMTDFNNSKRNSLLIENFIENNIYMKQD